MPTDTPRNHAPAAGHQHADESAGSRYTCPACKTLLRAGRPLQTRGCQAARLVS